MIRLGSRRRLLPVICCAMTLVAVGACRGGDRNEHRGGTMVIATPVLPPTVDPAVNYGTAWPELILTHDGLVAFRKVGGSGGTELVPDLARTLPDPTKAGTTYTFPLRKGIRYSDGTALRASDFTRVFERMFKMGGPTAGSLYRVIVGADGCLANPVTCSLAGGVVGDDAAGTVTFHLTRPDGEFLYKLALPFAFAVPPSAPATGDGTSPLPGTGPYMWKDHAPGDHFRLVRNPHFREWSEAAQPEGFVDEYLFRFRPPEDGIADVENNVADWAMVPGPFPADRLGDLTRRFPNRTHLNEVAAIFYIAFNTRVAPFNNVQVRRALNYATDRAKMVEIFGGDAQARPTCQMLPPGIPGYQPYCPYSKGGDGQVWRAPDMDEARRLIAQSNTAGASVTVVLPDIPAGRAAGDYFVDLLTQLGYRPNLRTLPLPMFDPYVKNSQNDVQLSLDFWFLDYPAPSNFLHVLTSCDSFRANSPLNTNIAGFCDRDISAQMDRALALGATDQEAANRLWTQIDRQVTDAAPEIVLLNPSAVTFLSQRVGNFQFHPQWQFLLGRAWVR